MSGRIARRRNAGMTRPLPPALLLLGAASIVLALGLFGLQAGRGFRAALGGPPRGALRPGPRVPAKAEPAAGIGSPEPRGDGKGAAGQRVALPHALPGEPRRDHAVAPVRWRDPRDQPQLPGPFRILERGTGRPLRPGSRPPVLEPSRGSGPARGGGERPGAGDAGIGLPDQGRHPGHGDACPPSSWTWMGSPAS